MKYYLNKQSGFTLVETLVAITVLLLVIIGPMTISSSIAKSTSFSSEQVIAFFLAQEGAEMAQKARDDLLLESIDAGSTVPNEAWDALVDPTGTYEHCFHTRGCGLEYADGSPDGSFANPVRCDISGGGNECQLYKAPLGGKKLYTIDSVGNEKALYIRTINFEETDSDKEVKVTAKVQWRTGSQRAVQEVEVVTYLYNVYGK